LIAQDHTETKVAMVVGTTMLSATLRIMEVLLLPQPTHMLAMTNPAKVHHPQLNFQDTVTFRNTAFHN